MEAVWHSLSVETCLQKMESSADGLTSDEAKNRLLRYGLNKVKGKEQISPLKIFLSQFQGMLVYLLFGAGILSFLIGEHIDGIAIIAILLLNGILGFVQEFKAEKAMEALKGLESPTAKVLRNGQELLIAAEEVVPGDVIIINEGDKIPADARIIEEFNFEVEEAILTGESRPVAKIAKVLAKNLALPDRRNLIFSATIATKGRAKALVYATGMDSEIGHIAQLVSESEEGQTPLQATLEKLGKTLGLLCVAIAVPGLILGLIKGREMVEMVMTSISLAVSAIPEGLPVVVTIALALGTRRMVKRGVLIRKLPAVEALGSADVICSDKTGTITLNKMTVTDLWLPRLGLLELATGKQGTEVTVTANPDFSLAKLAKYARQKFAKFAKDSDFQWLFLNGVLCNDSALNFGDPTEKALLFLAEQAGISTHERVKQYPRTDELPFDSANKYMATLNKLEKEEVAFIKGAPEVVLAACSQIRIGDKIQTLTAEMKKKILSYNETLSAKALRVLAFAYKAKADKKRMKQNEGYVLQGLVGMIDPPRTEVKAAIKRCKEAGIRVLMITGDHPLTAAAIAKKIGLVLKKVITGAEIDAMKEGELQSVVEKQTVFARVSPEHKLMILRALQKNKHLVAMTGDGVNDAPALKEANIGIAVGSGSDLAKEISDMILLDDNFSTIVKAIEEGRGIFFNIKKFVKFLIAANFDEILVIFTSILFGMPLPFVPIQLLWLNLATDSLPALALSLDSYEKGIMKKKPYNPSKEIMHGVLTFSILAGFIAYLSTIGVFTFSYYLNGETLRLAQTMTFSTMVLFELIIVFSCRSEKSAFAAGIFSNRFLLISVAIGLIMQFFAVYFPYTHEVFKTVGLTADQLGMVILFSSLGFILIEGYRLIKIFLLKKSAQEKPLVPAIE